ncbi:tripartite motif-containing protein 3-like [Ptychodera flava]|uniref:tripartite motif-containing protein 3-like n=1 Tax=Ptychodera flava TaxID=63121 RepID=UPI003969E5DB
MGCVASVNSDCAPFRNLNLPCVDRQAENYDEYDIEPYAAGRGDVMDEAHDNPPYADIEEDDYASLDAQPMAIYTVPLAPEGPNNNDQDILTDLADRTPGIVEKLTRPEERASIAISLSDLSVSSPSPEDFSRRFLECSICLDQYKNPKILPCYHSFCQECLEKMCGKAAEKIACPVCNQQHELPAEGGVQALPNSTILNDLLDFASQSQSLMKDEQKDEKISAVHLCGSCKKKNAENFCVDCGILICGDCRETHRNIPVTKKHQLMTLNEYRDKILVQSQVYRPVVCPLHEGNQISFYCGSCEVPVCEECTVEKHKRPAHQLEILKEAATRRRAKLQRVMQAGKKRLHALRQAKTTLDAEEKQSREEMRRESEKLDAGFQDLTVKLQKMLEYVENQRTKLAKEFEEEREKRQTEFEKQKRKTNMNLSEISKCVSDANTLFQHSNEVGFLYLANHSTSKIEGVLSDSEPAAVTSLASSNEHPKFSSDDELHKVKATVVDLLLASSKQ